LGQAKNDKGRLSGSLPSVAFCRLGIRVLLAQNSHLPDNTSAKTARTAQFCCYSLPISCMRTQYSKNR
jgi:hypothetical protein